LRSAEASGTPVHEIGRVEQGEGVILLDEKGAEMSVARPGFTHF